MFSGETFGGEISWEGYLGNEVKTSKMKIRAELEKKTLTLRDLASLQVGSTIVMENEPEDDVKITCNGIDLFKGKLGSFDEHVAISVTDTSILKQLV